MRYKERNYEYKRASNDPAMPLGEFAVRQASGKGVIALIKPEWFPPHVPSCVILDRSLLTCVSVSRDSLCHK